MKKCREFFFLGGGGDRVPLKSPGEKDVVQALRVKFVALENPYLRVIFRK